MKIFFDVDGVLIDGWHANPALRNPWDATMEEDLGVDREAFRRLLFGAPDRPGGRAAAPMAACVTGQRDLREALAEILPTAGYNGEVDAFLRYWFEKDSRLNPKVFALVDRLREQEGIALYVATGQEHHRARYLWEELGFSDRFARLFYSAAIGYPKKDPRFFAAINEALAITPDERPIFFDDQPEIAAVATEAGWDGTPFNSADDIRNHPRLSHLFQ